MIVEGIEAERHLLDETGAHTPEELARYQQSASNRNELCRLIAEVGFSFSRIA